MSRVCIRVDAYPEIGYGHLKRCLVIAGCLRERGKEVFFLLVGDSAASAEIQKADFDLVEIEKETSFLEQINAIESYGFENIGVTIVDISHIRAIQDSKGLALYLKELTNKSFTVLIDSFGVQSARENIPKLFCNILVSPYVGEQKSKKQINYTELLGVEYFVLDSAYQNYRKKNIREFANKILITCGGSDPSSISIKILNALNSDKKRTLNIKVIVGSGFSSELNEILLNFSKYSPHNVDLVINPDDLSSEMSWCDIAISTSGLTKYELAATGTPAILMSIDSSHDTVNQYFTSEKSVVDLGDAKNVTDVKLLNSVWMLLKNEDERARQSLAGQNFINGNGTGNLVEEIFKIKNDVTT
jgi:UDP-2,4-diacetamido-2,4,6-trideoxy-beta-L-altropyranose hydrolase